MNKGDIVYLVTCEWRVLDEVQVEDNVFIKEEDAQKYLKEDREEILYSIENGDYGELFEDAEIYDFSISNNNGDYFVWRLEELRLK